MFSWKLLKPLWVGKSSQNERERRLPKGAMRWVGSAFCQKSDRGPTVTWTRRRRRVSGSSWMRTALRDRPACYKNKTKEALCSRLQRLKWVLNYSNFVPAGPQSVSPVLDDLARLRATAKFQITPACDFRESILIPFFFWFVCMSRWLSFRFYFCLGFPAGRRTGSIALDRDEAKSTSSSGVLESLLNLFWWPFLPMFHCEKECLSVPGIRRLFRVVFFSCWQYI